MFTTNTLQNATPTTIQYQTSDGTLKPKIEGQKSGQQEYPTFCYTTNVNKIQMLTPTSQVKCWPVVIAQILIMEHNVQQ